MRLKVLKDPPTWNGVVKFLLRILTLISVLFVMVLLILDIFHHVIYIEPISVPAEFAANGFSADVAARELRDALDELTRKSNADANPDRLKTLARGRAAESYGSEIPSELAVDATAAPDLPPIIVPGTSLTIDTLAMAIQSFLGSDARTIISGEFVETRGSVSLLLRRHRDVIVKLDSDDLSDPSILVNRAALPVLDGARPHIGAAVHNLRGVSFSDEGRTKEALFEYNRSIELDQDYSPAYTGRGKIFYDRGDVRHAINDFEKAVSLDRNSAEAQNNLGAALGSGDLSDQKKASEHLDKAISLDPAYPDPHVNKGNLYVRLGQYENAIAQYKLAIQLNSVDSKAYYNMGYALYLHDENGAAIDAYRKAIDLNPNMANAYNNLGISRADEGDLKDAIEQYIKAIVHRPGDANFHNNLGLAYLANHQVDDAIRELEAAQIVNENKNPKNSTIMTNLAIALTDHGEFAEAIKLLYEALNVDQSNAHYSVLALCIASIRDEKDDTKDLFDLATKLEANKWPIPIIDYYFGKVDVKEVFRKADIGSEKTRRNQRCEADYYVGALYWAQGLRDKAGPRLLAATDECPHGFVEWSSAREKYHTLVDQSVP